MTSAEIITIGTEILLGEIVDTNTRHMAHALRGLGVDLYRTITIGDNVDRIASAIRESMQRAEIVITTGGLGPTVDDPTRDAVARAVGVETEFREELWEQVVAVIGRYGRKAAENQKRQAYVPKGAIAINNPVGTAPAFIVEIPSPPLPSPFQGEGPGVRVIISLPGVPKEMEYLFHESVIPYIQKRFDLRHVIKVRLIHTSGIGEGMIDEKIGDLEMLPNPTVGLAAHNGVVDIRVAAKAETEAEADRMIAEIERDLRERLGDVIFGVDEDRLEDVTFAAVSRQGWKLTLLGYGLNDSIIRRLPTLASLSDPRPDSLSNALRAAMEKDTATAGLAVASYVDEMAAEIVVITPRGEKSHHITYGGHPRNLARWAINFGLNMLRLRAEERA
ncbi:MAG: molybdopterin-binding protein [Chloroflexota bacterium]